MTSDIDAADVPAGDELAGRHVAFVGRLGGLTRREAQRLVRRHGGQPAVESREADLVVIGAEELLLDENDLLDETVRRGAAEGRVEILHETQLWERLGLVETSARLYTPAMLAELLQIPVASVRRWHRRGLIVPVREVHRLPYFDFQEVATARQLARLMAAGASPAAIEGKLARLSRFLPGVERPLAQLGVLVEGGQILLRQGDGLIEPGGQLRLDFDAAEEQAAEEGMEPAAVTLPLPDPDPVWMEPDDLVAESARCEDLGQLEAAVEYLRAALAAGGPRPEWCFQLAELLYRIGDVSAARERYYTAIELDEDYVEARANLGCVLAETGQLELAVAAYEGALQLHTDYPDVHYHLARALDELGRRSEALAHWRSFVELAPDSPWSEEARLRLQEGTREL